MKPALEDLMEAKLPIKVASDIAEEAAKLADHLMVLNQLRRKLFTEYGQRNPAKTSELLPPNDLIPEIDKDGKEILDNHGLINLVRNPQSIAYEKDMTELMGKEIELDIQVVKIPSNFSKVCQKCGNTTVGSVEIKPSTLMVLKNIIQVA